MRTPDLRFNTRTCSIPLCQDILCLGFGASLSKSAPNMAGTLCAPVNSVIGPLHSPRQLKKGSVDVHSPEPVS